MKSAVFLLLSLFTFSSYADFNEAALAYENKQYEDAFKIFNRLAKLGNKRAQFNVGVMYLNGEYVAKDPIQAFAWGRLSENSERPEFAQISKNLTQSLSAEDLVLAKSAFNTLKTKYGEAQIYTDLSPIIFNDSQSSDGTFTLETVKRKAPIYPEKALKQGVQGWATVGFEIYPDGTVRDPYIIESYPDGVFDRVSIESVLGFKFVPKYAENVEPFPIMGKQTIEYQVNTRSSSSSKNRLIQMYQQRLDRLRKYANDGSAHAQYLYAIAGSAQLIPEETRISQQEANEWLFKSAQNGHIQAQYHLGRNILRGNGCQVEKQKGIDWIVYAAEQGHSKSSRLAYQLLTKNQHLNNTDKPASHWLAEAAKNGDPDAQLDYAQHLLFDSKNPTSHITEAHELLEQHRKQRNRSVKFYQVSAQLYRLQNKNKKADKAQKKANKMAKKLGWEI